MNTTKKQHREPKRSAGGHQTRSRILRSAGKVFAAKGYAGASLRHVAGDCGVALSNIVYYFPTKHALFLETIRHFALDLAELNASFAPLFAVNHKDKQGIADAMQQSFYSMLHVCHRSERSRDLNALYIHVIADGDQRALAMLFECFAEVQKNLRNLAAHIRPDFKPEEIAFFQQLLWSLLQYTIVGRQLILHDMKLHEYTDQYLRSAATHFAGYCASALGLPKPGKLTVKR